MTWSRLHRQKGEKTFVQNFEKPNKIVKICHLLTRFCTGTVFEAELVERLLLNTKVNGLNPVIRKI